MRERSALTITEVPGRSTIDLDSGKVAVAVAKDKMRPGEQIEVKTPNAVAAVRGTVFIAEVIRASASANNAQGGTTANFYVLTGQVAVTSGTQVITVGPNNFATVTGGIVNTGIMSPAMRANAAGWPLRERHAEGQRRRERREADRDEYDRSRRSRRARRPLSRPR